MSNEVDICNLGLSYVGAENDISQLTANATSREGRLCFLHYPQARDAALSDVDWHFARSRPVTLSPISELHPDYGYAYLTPTNCLVARKIRNAAIRDNYAKIPFECFLTSDGKLAIATDEYQAQLIYTQHCNNAAIYPPPFVECLAWRLAAALALPFSGKLEEQAQLLKTYQIFKNQAAQISLNQEHFTPTTTSGYQRARE